MIEKILDTIRPLIPTQLFRAAQPIYHYTLALLGAIIYRFPSRKIKVVGVTGTKGKSTVVEIVNSILEEAGFVTALSNTIRFKVAGVSHRNLYKMSMPGRFFMQRFLRDAVNAGCNYVIVEMTSEGAKFFRHRFIDLDALIFTNLSPEHIESHGSFENYRDAKLSIAERLHNRSKQNTVLVVNKDDEMHAHFEEVGADTVLHYGLEDAQHIRETKEGLSFTWHDTRIRIPLKGEFNVYNTLAAITYTLYEGINYGVIARGVERVEEIPGRVEFIDEGQSFPVVVDYAHTPDSLEKLYGIFDDTKNICVLGNTGGGRDTWKRKVMAEIADEHCEHIILTNEDPYDERPRDIVEEMAEALPQEKYDIIMDRRLAIRAAIGRADENSAVLITGKGTDPYIMGPGGSKTPWDDATVAREELIRYNNTQ